MSATATTRTPRTARCYLLHFERPLHHAQHYLGTTLRLGLRLTLHQIGRGARLPAAFREHQIGFELARTWRGYRDKERQLKARKNGRELCPICNPHALKPREKRFVDC